MRTLILLALFGALFAADAKAKDKAKDKAAADDGLKRTLMCERGDLQFSETFSDDTWVDRWGKKGAYWQAGNWTLVDGAIHSQEIKDENHHPALPHRLPMTDVVVQFRFRFVDCDAIFLGFDDKEHIARLFLRPDQVEITKTTGIGGTTKSESLDKAPARMEPGTWYTAVIELCGTDFCAHVDERWIAYGNVEGIEIPKNRIEMMCYGKGGVAEFDDVQIWSATMREDWDKRKPKILEAMKKRKP
jgi:hypothetical protein